MRVRYVPWFLAVLALGCGSGKTVPEPGAVLLTVKCTTGAPVPDELRVWAYDDAGILWDGSRIPEQGPLSAKSAQSLGTILLAPGIIKGRLRIHVRGLLGGARVLDGVLIVETLAGGERTHDILLDPAPPLDEDGDDVPDSIDDCPGVSNPAQGGCPAPVPDAATDGGDEPADAAAGPESGAERPRDGTPGLPDALPDKPPTETWSVSPEVGAELPADVPPGRFDGGAEAGRDASPESPDGESRRDAGPDAPGDAGDTRADEVGPDRPDLRPDARESGAEVSPDVAADAANVQDDGGCGDACGKQQGALCSTNAECASGACADGVCCTNACVGPCRSCSQPSANGVCQGYAAGSDPESDCQSGSTCNGAGACGPPPSNLPNGQLCSSPSQCRSGFCVDNVCCNSDCATPCMACGSGTCEAVIQAEDLPECTAPLWCNRKSNCVTK